METFNVRREQEVDFISRALIAAGVEIIQPPNPNLAPFVYEVALPDRRRYRLICYAFRANKYEQSGRPSDEHRFQVKYGSDFSRYYHLYLPSGPTEITLMFGVHLERHVLIAVDPAMHEWTWFSKSIEFKEADLEQVEELGWHGWERPRVRKGRRKLPLEEEENLQVEAILGLTQDRIIDYIQFEAIATGLDPGTRLRMIDEISEGETPEIVAKRVISPLDYSRSMRLLEQEMGFQAAEVADEILHAFRLKVALRGSIAERHLEAQLKSEPQFDSVERIDMDGQPDMKVVFRDRTFTFECKNVLRRRTKGGLAKVDFQKTRASKNDPCSRYYPRDHFDVLAACLQPVTTQWEFRYKDTATLNEHPSCKGRLSQTVYVDEGDWEDSPLQVLYRILSDR